MTGSIQHGYTNLQKLYSATIENSHVSSACLFTFARIAPRISYKVEQQRWMEPAKESQVSLTNLFNVPQAHQLLSYRHPSALIGHVVDSTPCQSSLKKSEG